MYNKKRFFIKDHLFSWKTLLHFTTNRPYINIFFIFHKNLRQVGMCFLMFYVTIVILCICCIGYSNKSKATDQLSQPRKDHVTLFSLKYI